MNKKIGQKATDTKNTTSKKFFRISARNLFLTYPKYNPADKKKFLSPKIIKERLTEKVAHRGIETIIIGEEISEEGYEHFHATLFLRKKINITSPTFLDIDGIHGSYETVRNKVQTLEYVTKDSNFISEGYDPEITGIGKFKDPFKNFTYACTFKNSDPEELLEKVLHPEEDKYNPDLFNMFNDYLKHPERYEKFLSMRRERNIKRLNDIWIREDKFQELNEFISTGIEKKWIDKTLYLHGKPGVGKSAFMRFLFKDQCFFLRDLNQARDFDSKKHKGIIFDDTNIKHLSRESIISLIEPDGDKVINIKYGTREIAPRTIAVVLNNFLPHEYFCISPKDEAVSRRLKVINLDPIPVGHDGPPAIVWENETLGKWMKEKYIYQEGNKLLESWQKLILAINSGMNAEGQALTSSVSNKSLTASLLDRVKSTEDQQKIK